jgi:histidinol-phosphate aminotransferase
MMEALVQTNRYPDEQVPVLKKEIAAHWKVAPENILMGAGSSEILGLVCQQVSSQKGHVITADPSYQVWHKQAKGFGLSVHTVPLNADRQLDLPAMARLVGQETRMFYICNPNNPTGKALPVEEVRKHALAVSSSCMVLVDEAYTEYSGMPSLAAEAVKNPNIVVAKTFSKIYGLAGARVGYAIAHPDTIRKLAAFQPWQDVAVSMVSAAAASAALRDQDFALACAEKTAQAREMCYTCFSSLGLAYLPSQTSFVLFDISQLKEDLSQKMLEQQIFVQYREHFGGKWCRVSMGTLEEMEVFCKALKSIART